MAGSADFKCINRKINGNYIPIQPNFKMKKTIEMRNDFETVEGADFNEALKILST